MQQPLLSTWPALPCPDIPCFSPKKKLQIFYRGEGEESKVQLFLIDFQIFFLLSVTSSPPFLDICLMLPISESLVVSLSKKLSCFLALSTAVSVGVHVSQSAKSVASYADAFQFPTLHGCHLSSCSLWPCRLMPKRKPKNTPPTTNQPATILYM